MSPSLSTLWALFGLCRQDCLFFMMATAKNCSIESVENKQT